MSSLSNEIFTDILRYFSRRELANSVVLTNRRFYNLADAQCPINFPIHIIYKFCEGFINPTKEDFIKLVKQRIYPNRHVRFQLTFISFQHQRWERSRPEHSTPELLSSYEYMDYLKHSAESFADSIVVLTMNPAYDSDNTHCISLPSLLDVFKEARFIGIRLSVYLNGWNFEYHGYYELVSLFNEHGPKYMDLELIEEDEMVLENNEIVKRDVQAIINWFDHNCVSNSHFVRKRIMHIYDGHLSGYFTRILTRAIRKAFLSNSLGTHAFTLWMSSYIQPCSFRIFNANLSRKLTSSQGHRKKKIFTSAYKPDRYLDIYGGGLTDNDSDEGEDGPNYQKPEENSPWQKPIEETLPQPLIHKLSQRNYAK